jgi:hypothetical protein
MTTVYRDTNIQHNEHAAITHYPIPVGRDCGVAAERYRGNL